MQYRIELSGMEFRAFHGCYDLEQKVGNRFRVDLVIYTELGDIAQSDDVSRAVNYLTVYETTREVMSRTRRTIESVAKDIIDTLKRRFEAIERVECRVSKLAPPLGGKVQKVSVVLEY